MKFFIFLWANIELLLKFFDSFIYFLSKTDDYKITKFLFNTKLVFLSSNKHLHTYEPSYTKYL